MSYSVNWITKVISIPTADLTLVSGARYSLDMADFLAEIRRLEWAFADGLWAPAILDHTNTRLDFAGANYAPFDDMINGYTVIITGIATRVDLLGSNNDIVDVLIPSGVSIVPSNSAGLQIVSVGSGLSAEQAIQLTELHSAKGLDGQDVYIKSAKAGEDGYIKVGSIDIKLTGDGEENVTMTRQ